MKKKLMTNFSKTLLFFIVIILVSACDTMRKGFQQDKRSGEEFLVEKKSPLVLPPDYHELPIPSQEKVKKRNNKEDIKKLLSKSKIQEVKEENEKTISSIEKLILKEIKKN